MPTAAILGTAGYTGQETLDRLLGHPSIEVRALGSDSQAGKPAQTLDPRLNGSLPAFVTNAHVLLHTCRPTCEACGTLYVGNSRMNAVGPPLSNDRLKIQAVPAAAAMPSA